MSKNNAKRLWPFMLLLLVLLITGCKSEGNRIITDENTVRIGVVEPISGENHAGGARELLGIEYANSLMPVLTVNGTEYTVELIKLDTTSDTERAKQAAKTLINAGVCAIISSENPYESLEISHKLRGTGIPVISAAFTDPDVLKDGTDGFSVNISDAFQAKTSAVKAKELCGEGKEQYTALVITGNTKYDITLSEAFEKEFASSENKVIVISDSESADEQIISAVDEADCIYITVFNEDTEALLKAISSTGTVIPLITSDLWSVNGKDIIPDDLKAPVYSPMFYNPEEAEDFISSFTTWLKDDELRELSNGGSSYVSYLSLLAYDAYNALTEAVKAALEKGGETSSDITNALKKQNFTGVSGSFTFGKDGMATDKALYYVKLN